MIDSKVTVSEGKMLSEVVWLTAQLLSINEFGHFFNVFDFSVSLTVEVTVSNRKAAPGRSISTYLFWFLTVGSTVSGTKSIVLIDA